MVKNIYIFSPSIDVDHSWESVKKYMKEDLKLNETEEEKYFFLIIILKH